MLVNVSCAEIGELRECVILLVILLNELHVVVGCFGSIQLRWTGKRRLTVFPRQTGYCVLVHVVLRRHDCAHIVPLQKHVVYFDLSELHQISVVVKRYDGGAVQWQHRVVVGDG